MADLPTLGPRGAVDLIQTYAGIDFSRVLNFQNRQGLTGQQILQQAYAAIGGVNQALINKYGDLLYVTTADTVLYRTGETSRTKTPKKVEFTRGDSVRTNRTGHSLPLSDYEDVLDWGEIWLRDAKQSDIDDDLQLMTERWQNRVEDDVLSRMFTSTEYPQGVGYDVGWAVGSGVNVPYIPSPQSGVTFDSTHTHYKFATSASSAAVQTLIETLVGELRHHGHGGSLTALVSESDVSIYTGMSKFVALQPAGFMIVPGNGSTAVQVAQGTVSGMPGELFGYVNTSKGIVELRYYNRIPSGYIFMSKSYGQNNPSNGLALRVHPDIPFGLMPRPIIDRTMTPVMEGIKLVATHGVGVNKRLNGVAGYFAASASAYVNPSFAN